MVESCVGGDGSCDQPTVATRLMSMSFTSGEQVKIAAKPVSAPNATTIAETFIADTVPKEQLLPLFVRCRSSNASPLRVLGASSVIMAGAPR